MKLRLILTSLLLAALCASLGSARVHAIGDATDIDLRTVEYTGADATLHPTAMKRLAWEVRQRTSVSSKLEPTRSRFSDPNTFQSPFLYWTGSAAFPPLSEAEVIGLRRFVEFGGFVLIDDANPEQPGFDASVRRELSRAFGTTALIHVPSTHVLYRSFYLLQHPNGRLSSPEYLEGIERSGRLAVVYTRHDLGGALERDNLGNYANPLSSQDREMAFRLGVNVVLYALCLDYKDDQVHAPFILRRWAGRP